VRFLWLFAFLVFGSISVNAQEVEDYTLIGAGVRTRPAYDGSKKQTTEVVPVLRYYGKTLFARTTQGILEAGARTEAAPGVALGVQLAYEAGRRRGPGTHDVDSGASIGAHVEWDAEAGPVPLVLLARVRQNADRDHGAQADARVTAGVYQDDALVVGVFTQATWASRRALRAYYETGGSGLLHAGVGLLATYRLGASWTLLGSVEGRRLQGEAKDSPLAQRRSNVYAGAGLAYRF